MYVCACLRACVHVYMCTWVCLSMHLCMLHVCSLLSHLSLVFVLFNSNHLLDHIGHVGLTDQGHCKEATEETSMDSCTQGPTTWTHVVNNRSTPIYHPSSPLCYLSSLIAIMFSTIIDRWCYNLQCTCIILTQL